MNSFSRTTKIIISLVVLTVVGFLGWQVSMYLQNQSAPATSGNAPVQTYQFDDFVRSVSGNQIKIGGPNGDWLLNISSSTKILRPISKKADGTVEYKDIPVKELIRGLGVLVTLDHEMKPGEVSADQVKEISLKVYFGASTSTTTTTTRPK